jgi:uncharacterized protein YjbI with pentapeptide repeats
MTKPIRNMLQGMTIMLLATPLVAQEDVQTLLDSRQCVGCVLLDTALADESFVSADMSGSTISDVDFEGSNLFLSIFDGAVLENVSFRGANLRSATFSQAVLRNVDFTGADLTGARLNGADMDLAALVDAITCNVTMPDGLAAMDGCN